MSKLQCCSCLCRVQMTISLPTTATEGLQSARVLPMYVLLARLESEVNSVEVVHLFFL